jgi:hypothetical protein
MFLEIETFQHDLHAVRGTIVYSCMSGIQLDFHASRVFSSLQQQEAPSFHVHCVHVPSFSAHCPMRVEQLSDMIIILK